MNAKVKTNKRVLFVFVFFSLLYKYFIHLKYNSIQKIYKSLTFPENRKIVFL